MKRNTFRFIYGAAGVVFCGLLQASDASFIGNLNNIKAHASTVPANGDVNPYGVAVVPQTVGNLLANHILVSNFNNSSNLQGTGTTIVQISPGDGSVKLFAQINASQISCPGGVGLTTALVVLRSGWVIVGSLPTSDGSTFTGPGCLIVLNSSGQVAETITDMTINGPWDMTALDMGSTAALFVTNVLNGITTGPGHAAAMGTVLRINLNIPSGGMPAVVTPITTIGDGFSERTDPAALILGPTGVGLASDGTLYVADTVNSRIQAIQNAVNRMNSAGTGMTVSGGSALNAPLGLAIAPNGNIITVNGGDGNMVETTPGGTQVAVKFVDVTGGGAGDLFGLAIGIQGSTPIYFVNDGNNTLDRLH